MNFGATYIL